MTSALHPCPECGHALERIHTADGCSVCACIHTPEESELA